MDTWTWEDEKLEQAFLESERKRNEHLNSFGRADEKMARAVLEARNKNKPERGRPNIGGKELVEWAQADSIALNVELRPTARLRSLRNELSPLDGTAGGWLYNSTLNDAIEAALIETDPVRRFATVIRRPSNTEVLVPTTDDTANKGVRVPFGETPDDATLTFGQKRLHAFGGTYSSGICVMPMELEQDSELLVGSLGRLLGQRLALIQNEDYTTGALPGYPQGIILAAPIGVTAASATTVTPAELLALAYSVPAPYRANSRWMMHPDIALALRQMTDGAGRFVWKDAGLDDWPTVENPEMASAMAASAKPILFGDFSKYLIKDSPVVRVTRIVEAEGYIENGQIGYVANHSSDGVLLDAGTGPIQALQMAAA